jgi:hypothetical protein
MLRGFSWGLVGSLTCLCAEATSSGDCRLSMTDVCARPPPCLQQTCASGGVYPLTRAAVASVYACLHTHGAGVKCPELAPSDVWGLFPVSAYMLDLLAVL